MIIFPEEESDLGGHVYHRPGETGEPSDEPDDEPDDEPLQGPPSWLPDEDDDE